MAPWELGKVTRWRVLEYLRLKAFVVNTQFMRDRGNGLNIFISSSFFRTILRCFLHGFSGISKNIRHQVPISEPTHKNQRLLVILFPLSLLLLLHLYYLDHFPQIYSSTT